MEEGLYNSQLNRLMSSVFRVSLYIGFWSAIESGLQLRLVVYTLSLVRVSGIEIVCV
jgi:hypothetical protein